jgi:hypothetical protein
MRQSDINEPAEIEKPQYSPSKIRWRGLFLILAGASLTPVFFVVAYLFGLVLANLFDERGPIKIEVGLVAIPLAIGFEGVIELVTGMSIRRLNNVANQRVSASSLRDVLVLIGVLSVLIATAVAFVALAVFLYRVFDQGTRI